MAKPKIIRSDGKLIIRFWDEGPRDETGSETDAGMFGSANNSRGVSANYAEHKKKKAIESNKNGSRSFGYRTPNTKSNQGITKASSGLANLRGFLLHSASLYCCAKSTLRFATHWCSASVT